MTILIDTQDIIDDEWEYLADDETTNPQSKIILSLDRLRCEWQRLRTTQLTIGVELKPDDVVEELSFCTDKLELIVLRFDSFADGRAFSQAKMLRDRYHYRGEIRATGEVIRDQLGFMQRCGFSQFEIGQSEDRQMALQAFGEITHGYQSDLIRTVRY